MHLIVQQWITHYGYLGVFFILMFEMIGIPFPAETTLTISGFEWTKGVFHLTPLFVSAVLGNIVGSTIAYAIGRFMGRPVILKFGRFIGIHEQKLNQADKKFSSYRDTIVFGSKFIAGIRVLVPYLAGINKMPLFRFTLINAFSAAVWALVFIILGSTVGVLWTRYHQILHQWLVPSGILLVLIIGASLYIKRRSNHRKKL